MPKIIKPGQIPPKKFWRGVCKNCGSVCIYDEKDVGRYIATNGDGLATCPTCHKNVWGNPYKPEIPYKPDMPREVSKDPPMFTRWEKFWLRVFGYDGKGVK